MQCLGKHRSPIHIPITQAFGLLHVFPRLAETVSLRLLFGPYHTFSFNLLSSSPSENLPFYLLSDFPTSSMSLCWAATIHPKISKPLASPYICEIIRVPGQKTLLYPVFTCLSFWDRVLINSPVCPWTHDPPASISQILGLQVSSTTPTHHLFLLLGVEIWKDWCRMGKEGLSCR
jgi:hypothetical protein